jgi:hypothetical protein
LPQGGLASAAAEAEAGFGSLRSRWSVGAAQVARLGNPAICGVLVSRSRLQKSARSIFCATPRGAERQTEGWRGSKARRLRP